MSCETAIISSSCSRVNRFEEIVGFSCGRIHCDGASQEHQSPVRYPRHTNPEPLLFSFIRNTHRVSYSEDFSGKPRVSSPDQHPLHWIRHTGFRHGPVATAASEDVIVVDAGLLSLLLLLLSLLWLLLCVCVVKVSVSLFRIHTKRTRRTPIRRVLKTRITRRVRVHVASSLRSHRHNGAGLSDAGQRAGKNECAADARNEQVAADFDG